MPATAAFRARVDVPEAVMLAGLTVAVTPAGGEVVRVTVPVKPLRGARAIVEMPVAPGLRGPTVLGLVEMVKSTTATVTLTVWNRVPLVPVTVTK